MIATVIATANASANLFPLIDQLGPVGRIQNLLATYHRMVSFVCLTFQILGQSALAGGVLDE